MRIPMPLIVFVAGLLLTGLGLLAYFAFATGEDRSMTALIPAFWGVPIMLCAFASLLTRSIRKHAMHLVAILALLGVAAREEDLGSVRWATHAHLIKASF